MKLKDIGEFELIERMAHVFRWEKPGSTGERVVPGLTIGIGDDAAIWASPRSGYTIATTDSMVEGIHFTAQTTDWYDLGWKAMASNISDIAGTGGVPLYALVALAAPGDLEVEIVEEICRGMADLAWSFGAAVVGGDTVSSPTLTLSVTLIGEALPGPEGREPRILSRFKARPGDVIAVTGSLGSSAGGLELMLSSSRALPEDVGTLLDAHRRPRPRIREGQLLVESGIRCGMDLSDGLAGDLQRICRASGVGAVIFPDRLPMDPALTRHFGERATALALSGGEDYELLCGGPADVIERAQDALESIGTVLTVVGSFEKSAGGRPGVLLADRDGKRYPPPRAGWEHFSA